eukprot:3360417-Prymnesium_polylepis.1
MTDAPADTAEVKPCACTLNWSPVTMPSPDALSVMLNMLWFAAAHCNPSQSMHSWRRPPSERRPASQRVHPNGSHDSCADISAWPGQQNDVTRMTRTPSTRSRAVISDELAKTIVRASITGASSQAHAPEASRTTWCTAAYASPSIPIATSCGSPSALGRSAIDPPKCRASGGATH